MSTAKSIININLIVVVTLLIGVANNIAIAGFFGLTRLVDASCNIKANEQSAQTQIYDAIL